MGGVAAYVDAEHALDIDYAKKLGVNVEDLLVSQPDTGEQALEIVDILVRSGAVDLVVIDSVAALVPKAEIEGEMGESSMGVQARLMSQALRKLAGAINRSNTSVVFINQLREKIGVMFGNPETTTGGKALKFYASLRLDIRRIGPVKEREAVIGNHVRVKVVKNKVAPPFRQAEFDIMFDEGISHTSLLVDLAAEANIIQKSGAWYSYNDQRIGQGRENAKLFLRDNPPLHDRDRGQGQGAARHAAGAWEAERGGGVSGDGQDHGRLRHPDPRASGSLRVEVDGERFASVAPGRGAVAAVWSSAASWIRICARRSSARPTPKAAYRTALARLERRSLRPAPISAAGCAARDIRPRRSRPPWPGGRAAGCSTTRPSPPTTCETRSRREGGARCRLARDLLAMGVERGVIDRAIARTRRIGRRDRADVPLALAAKRAAQLGDLPRAGQATPRAGVPRAARVHRPGGRSEMVAASVRRLARAPLPLIFSPA